MVLSGVSLHLNLLALDLDQNLVNPYCSKKRALRLFIKKQNPHTFVGYCLKNPEKHSLLPGNTLLTDYIILVNSQNFNITRVIQAEFYSQQLCAYIYWSQAFYFAVVVSVARTSRMTVTFICPAYSASFSSFLAILRAKIITESSSTSSGLTIILTSRPA